MTHGPSCFLIRAAFSPTTSGDLPDSTRGHPSPPRHGITLPPVAISTRGPTETRSHPSMAKGSRPRWEGQSASSKVNRQSALSCMAKPRHKCLSLTEAIMFSTILDPTKARSQPQWDGVDNALQAARPVLVPNTCLSAQLRVLRAQPSASSKPPQA